MTTRRKPMHGTSRPRGCSHARLGDFCRMFPDIGPSQAKDCGYQDDPCRADQVASLLGGPGGPMHDTRGETPDSPLPAGYTLFAQFVDHDVTLDTQSRLHDAELSDLGKLGNLRTASLDLDCVYGFGPEASPHLYDPSQDGRLLVGSEVDGVVQPDDVPRNDAGRALLGDPRNDENLFVSQLQLAFLRFHNRFLVRYPFEEAQREARYHYQWVVWNDFLRRVCHAATWEHANERLLDLDHPFPVTPICPDGRPCMPVEFAGAAYRFGHTTVRSVYPANADHPAIELFDERFQTLGFGQVPAELVVDWSLLLDMDDGTPYRRAKAFDALLPDELIRMPDPVVGSRATADERSLAFRNLRRGVVLGLPSGQRVAQALAGLGYPDIDPALNLRFPDCNDKKSKKGDKDTEPDPFAIAWCCLPDDIRGCLEEHTPLFLYLMREGAVTEEGQRLGPVGSAILLETFGAMLRCCKSYVNDRERPGWQPSDDVVRGARLTLSDIIRFGSP